MFLLFVLCIKLSLLHLCVSDLGYKCGLDNSRNDPKIYLINDDKYNYEQRQINHLFKRTCEQYYDITILPSLQEATEKKYENIIRLAVADYYNGKELNGFVYAGNITKTDHVICHKSQPKEDCNDVAILVSDSVTTINDGHLYDFVQEMQYSTLMHYLGSITKRETCKPFYRRTVDLTEVGLCLRNPYERKVNIKPLQLVQMSNIHCLANLNNLQYVSNVGSNRFLALLAPEPFEVRTEYLVPTIFYESPYIYAENKTAFPNSMNLLPWRLLKYGFLKFIQKAGWQRVAIVTDDSEYSIEFEEELTALFSKERLTYTVIRCEDAHCDMEKIVQELDRVSARIVIANVEERNAEYLFQHLPSKRFTWLVRDMARKREHQHLTEVQFAFSISLQVLRTAGCNVEDNILSSLSSIVQANSLITEEDHKLKKHEFYKRFADNTRTLIPRIIETMVVVKRLFKDSSRDIAEMHVNESGVEMIYFEDPFQFEKPVDGTGHCLVTSYDYHKPCEDPLVLLLMFTLMVFVVTFLLITCYFDKTSPFNDIRYQNF